jgi:hypothetical protein
MSLYCYYKVLSKIRAKQRVMVKVNSLLTGRGARATASLPPLSLPPVSCLRSTPGIVESHSGMSLDVSEPICGPSSSQDPSRHSALQCSWERGLIKAADLGATPTRKIDNSLLYPRSLCVSWEEREGKIYALPPMKKNFLKPHQQQAPACQQRRK